MRYDELKFLMTLPLFSVLIKAIKKWMGTLVYDNDYNDDDDDERKFMLYKTDILVGLFFVFFWNKIFLEIVN